MKTKLLVLLLLLAGTSAFAARRVVVGIGVGGYAYGPGYYAVPPAPPVAVYAPPCPGPGYTWAAGYWYPIGPRHYWHAGYWRPPVFGGAFWSGPRFYGGYYWRGGHRYWRR